MRLGTRPRILVVMVTRNVACGAAFGVGFRVADQYGRAGPQLGGAQSIAGAERLNSEPLGMQ